MDVSRLRKFVSLNLLRERKRNSGLQLRETLAYTDASADVYQDMTPANIAQNTCSIAAASLMQNKTFQGDQGMRHVLRDTMGSR
jgi:hypothetical protein